ncbi:MAG TPA: methyltransferase domain-containing protein, partial [Ilumatobacteraceae bacterium]|nr:methyltransferase domain-containing protein [Ilumatobacteraceae bacterium]
MRGYDDETYGEAFADIYDDWYGDLGDLDTTVATLAELARGGRVLELGVGTGRIAIPLAPLVGEVLGVDTSAAMLDRLASKLGGDRVGAVRGDMVDGLPQGPFALAFVAYNTLFNLRTAARQAEC